MSFMLHFKGGPMDTHKEESRHAPQTLTLDAEEAGGTPGIYRLGKIVGIKAIMEWHPRPLRAPPEPVRQGLNDAGGDIPDFGLSG